MFKFFNDKWAALTKGAPQSLFQKIQRLNTPKIAIYGAGEIGSELLKLLNNDDSIEVLMIVDRRAEFVEVKLQDFDVKSPAELASLPDCTIVIASEKFVAEMKENIRKVTADSNSNIITI